jgi:hypothetical protein
VPNPSRPASSILALSALLALKSMALSVSISKDVLLSVRNDLSVPAALWNRSYDVSVPPMVVIPSANVKKSVPIEVSPEISTAPFSL